jgi:hypothetical protein
MSFYHRCAVGFFDPESLAICARLRAVRRLPRDEVEAMVREYLSEDDLQGTRPAYFWRDGYVVVEYIALRSLPRRIELVQEIMKRLGATAVDIIGDDVVRAKPWKRA